MSDITYPPDEVDRVEEAGRSYRDEAAVALYKEAGVQRLVSAHMKATSALIAQTELFEKFHNTPYTNDHALLIATTTDTIAKLEAQLERWHFMLFPNQRPRPYVPAR